MGLEKIVADEVDDTMDEEFCPELLLPNYDVVEVTIVIYKFDLEAYERHLILFKWI